MSSSPVPSSFPSGVYESPSRPAAHRGVPPSPGAEIARLESAMRDHLVQAIERTPLETDPFPYVFIRGCFPEALYEELLAALPSDDFYEPLIHKDSVRDDGSSPRIQAPLS